MPDFTIITVTMNSALTLRDTVETVKGQVGVLVQHIVKDGGSTDGTLDMLVTSDNEETVILQQPDAGIYDAMNQGFRSATGNYIGFLNSDDYYAHENVLQKVLRAFTETSADLVYGDIQIIDDNGKVFRSWKSGRIKSGSLAGRQLPHPAFFVKRDVLERLPGPLDPSYKSAADYKQQLLLIEKLKLKATYIEETLTVMRAGGASTRDFRALANGWIESARAYREVHDRWGGWTVIRKILSKVPQIWS